MGSVPPTSRPGSESGGSPLPSTSQLSPGELLRKELQAAQALRGPETSFVTSTIEVPALSPSSLLAALPDQPFVAFGETIGLGMAAEHRRDRIDSAAARTWASSLLGGRTVAGRQTPQLFCGAAFAATTTGNERWRDFPALYVLLPRWTYQRVGRGASLTLTAPVDQLGNPAWEDRAMVELSRIVACEESNPISRSGPVEVERSVQMAPAAWDALVNSALGAIDSGGFQKLVLARTATVVAKEPWRAGEVLRKLGTAPGCSTFAVRLGSATFLGATPETLIATHDQAFETHALAGTIPASAKETGLTDSVKNGEEHRLVVAEIERRLRPLCSELVVAASVVVRLEDLMHLKTPISGRPKEGVHLLDLAGALHPTPAVGGLPTDRAVEWICEHEPEPRGWYAGFLGWFDRSGNGRLGVSIRSGLLSGRDACLYTGAGIVAGSQPAAEYQETEWKQRPFLRALGIETPP